MINVNNCYSKLCGVAYDIVDIKRIVSFCKKKGYFFYYIRHTDKDELMGDKYKRHYHFIIESNSYHRFNCRTLLTDTFKENLFQNCKSVALYLRYMLHLDYDDKPHYDLNRIVSNKGRDDLFEMISNANFTKRDINRANFNLILSKIVNREFSRWQDIIPFCLENGIDYSTSWTYTFRAMFD